MHWGNLEMESWNRRLTDGELFMFIRTLLPDHPIYQQ